MITNRCSLLFVAATLLLTACTTPPPTTAQPTSSEPVARRDNPQNLRKGMSEAEIRAVWGEPKAVHPGNEGVTLLVYQFDVHTSQRMVAASMEEVPAYDPVTGEPIRMMEAKLTPQSVTVVQTISLLLRDGRLQSWSRKLGEERSFN